jgi:TPP-dependent pyruvate/acetoin dehydrogenase alpha subunit
MRSLPLDWTHNKILAGGRYRGLNIDGVAPEVLRRLYRFMLRLRMLEEAVAREYHPADEMACPVHLCIGQEAGSAALSEVLQPHDYFYSHHRNHGYYLAKGAPMGALLAEMHGKATGANRGNAGSQDISMEANRFYGGAILAGAIGISVGTGLAIRLQGLQSVAVSGFGEGATDEGIFWEAVNYAALKKLPVLFFCENNRYATYSPQAARQPGDTLTEKVAAFGVPSRSLFGNDVVALYNALSETVDSVRSGQGPAFIQTYTYRWNSHVGPGDDSHLEYRSAAEKDFWRQNCPIDLLDDKMTQAKLITPVWKQQLERELRDEITEAFAFARNSPFPDVPNWQALNESFASPLADRLLAEEDREEFDGHQRETLPGPY